MLWYTEKHFAVLLTKHHVCCNDIIKTLSCFVAAPAIFSCFVFVKTFFCLGHLCQMGFFVILSEQPICYCVTSATSPHLLVYVSPSEKCLILLPTVQRVLFAYCGGIHVHTVCTSERQYSTCITIRQSNSLLRTKAAEYSCTQKKDIKTKEGKGRRCCLGDRMDSIPCRAGFFAPG